MPDSRGAKTKNPLDFWSAGLKLSFGFSLCYDDPVREQTRATAVIPPLASALMGFHRVCSG